MYLSLKPQLFPILAFFLVSLSLRAENWTYPVATKGGLCQIQATNRTPSDWVQALNASLTSSLGVSCRIISTLELEVARPAAGAEVLIFAADREPRSDDLVIRLLDAQSGREISLERPRLGSLTTSTYRAVVDDSVQRLLKSIPYSGYFNGAEFFYWGPSQETSLQRANVFQWESHPFLPKVMNPRSIGLRPLPGRWEVLPNEKKLWRSTVDWRNSSFYVVLTESRKPANR
jgi:hypothetical protein